MSRTTMVVFVFGILLLTYGYIARFLNIYFFWDSKYLGWIGVISGVLLFLIDVRMARLKQKQNILLVRILVALIIISLSIELSVIVLLKTTDIYNNVVESIEKDEGLKTEIGNIRGVGIIPGVSLIHIIQSPFSGSLTFIITVRGQKIYRDIEVNTENAFGIEWRVTSQQEVDYR